MSVIVLDSNENARMVLKTYLEELGYSDNLKLFSNYEDGINEIKTLDFAPIVLVDISSNEPKQFEIIEEIRLFTDKIIVTSIDYSTDSIVRAIRFGAKEFLPKPVLKSDLEHALKIFSNPEAESEFSASKIITVYSNKGGIGKTTIAVNLASELVKSTHDKVALVDLNLQLGDVSTFLNLNPSFDAAYVIKNLISKKNESIIQAFEKYKDTKLFVLSDPCYIEQSESITPQEIESLFKVLRKTFPYIVIDMSSNINPNTLKILDLSDMILFTTIVNIPAIRNTQRCLNLFKSRKYDANKVKILINRFMENDNISEQDIETALGEKIYWKLPNNYFSIMESINKGLTVSEVSVNSNIAYSFRNLALKISDEIVENSIIKYRGLL